MFTAISIAATLFISVSRLLWNFSLNVLQLHSESGLSITDTKSGVDVTVAGSGLSISDTGSGIDVTVTGSTLCTTAMWLEEQDLMSLEIEFPMERLAPLREIKTKYEKILYTSVLKIINIFITYYY